MNNKRNKIVKTDFFQSIDDRISDEFKSEVDFHLQILERINFLLQKKFDGKKNLLAKKLNKSEPQISTWFKGYQNFTLNTIFELEKAFEEKIIAVCRDGEEDDLCHTGDFVLVDDPKKSVFIPGQYTQANKKSSVKAEFIMAGE